MHEAGGHGGACLLLGGHITTLGAYYMECDTRGLSGWAARAVAGAGNSVNLLVGLAALAAFRLIPTCKPGAKLFLWLFGADNGMTWAGYYLFSGASGIGDWGGAQDAVFAGVKPVWMWRVPLTCCGAILYLSVLRVMARTLAGLVGGTEGGKRLGRAITVTAYVTGGLLAVLIGLLNPVGIAVTVASAAASSFGGTAGYLGLFRWLPLDGRIRTLVLRRNWAVIGAALCVASLYAVVLGPSVRFQ